MDFNTVTFNAGSTYKFYLDGTTLQTNDIVDIVDANGNGITGNDGLTQSGGSGPGYAGTYFQYAIPSDVAPGKFITFTDGATSTAYADVPLTIAGSTYTTSVTGVTSEGGTGSLSGTTFTGAQGDTSWLSVDDTLAAGQRIVFDSAFITDLHASMPDYSQVFIGLKADNWTNASIPLGSHKGNASIRFMKIQGDVGQTGLFVMAFANGTLTSQFYAEDLTNVQAFIEVTSDGNNIRLGIINSSSYNATTDLYDNWDSGQRVETGDQGYGITTIDAVLFWGAANTGGGVNTVGWDYSEVDWTGLSEVSVPALVSNDTSWTKALDFSGSNEHAKMVSSSLFVQPLQMGGLANLVDLGTASQGGTSNHTSARPWATSVVFKADGNNSNQIIWNQGEGSSSGNDNIYLRLSAAGSLFFGWGREGSGYNECRIANQNISSSNWYGVSIAHNGVRLGGNNASASNLADCFTIYMMSSADSFAAVGSNLSVTANWTSTGNRMDRTVAGDFTIGGRGTNRSFHGKVASVVVTPLVQNTYNSSQFPEGTMVNADEAKMMITDPVQWVENYRSRLGSGNPGGLYRKSAERFSTNYFTFSNAYQHVQVWLMGDGTNDSYSNGVRNYINPSDQNWVKVQLNNMQSSDIENVSIPGLS